MAIDLSKDFIGLVLNNNDPDRKGKVKIRVLNLFDNLSEDKIPWAKPQIDSNGNTFNIPDVGKIVNVKFENNDMYSITYTSAEHYNANLQKKLSDLSENDYMSSKVLLYDHLTQIYRNNSEGLVIDHNVSNLTIDKDANISLNLKDKNSIITLGSNNADESVILGNIFMDALDSLLNALMTAPYNGNIGYPVTPSPEFVNSILDFKAKKVDFLSKHVYISKNNNIVSLGNDRPSTVVVGDEVNVNGNEDLNKKTKVGELKPKMVEEYTNPIEQSVSKITETQKNSQINTEAPKSDFINKVNNSNNQSKTVINEDGEEFEIFSVDEDKYSPDIPSLYSTITDPEGSYNEARSKMAKQPEFNIINDYFDDINFTSGSYSDSNSEGLTINSDFRNISRNPVSFKGKKSGIYYDRLLHAMELINKFRKAKSGSRCGRYAINFADLLNSVISKNNTSIYENGSFLERSVGGNADAFVYGIDMKSASVNISTFYTKVSGEVDLTRYELLQKLQSFDYKVGDVIAYFAKNTENSSSTLFHAQVYVSDFISNNKEFVSDFMHGYFVYSNRKVSANYWGYAIYRNNTLVKLLY